MKILVKELFYVLVIVASNNNTNHFEFPKNIC